MANDSPCQSVRRHGTGGSVVLPSHCLPEHTSSCRHLFCIPGILLSLISPCVIPIQRSTAHGPDLSHQHPHQGRWLSRRYATTSIRYAIAWSLEARLLQAPRSPLRLFMCFRLFMFVQRILQSLSVVAALCTSCWSQPTG